MKTSSNKSNFMSDLPDLANLSNIDKESLIALDKAGFGPGREDGFEEFKEKLLEQDQVFYDFEQELETLGEAEAFGIKINKDNLIPDDIIAEAGEITEPLYGFKIKTFPGFFLSKDIGLLWGGCLISEIERPFSLFLIRNSFRNKNRFLMYSRKELMAHELCHFFRQPLNDNSLEEFFAYQTSPSWFRRYIGNCFIKQYDAVLFMVPAIILCIAVIFQSFVFPYLWTWPFWVLVPIWPIFLLWRNARSRRRFFKTHKKLRSFGIEQPMPVLFRLIDEDLDFIAQLNSRSELEDYVQQQAETLLRFKIIKWRFL